MPRLRPRLWLGLVSPLILLASPPAVPAVDLAGLRALPNPACVHFTVLGPCLCGGTVPGCVTLVYWEPAALVETVKVSGSTSLPVAGSLLQQLIGTVGLAGALGGGGAGNASGAGQTNLHFNEAHVMPFPQLLPGPCDACTSDARETVQLNYVSEIDPLWRRQTGRGLPNLRGMLGLGTLGVWAPLYPRVGFAIHGSEPVGSAIAACRALHIANQPVEAPLGAGQPAVRPVLKQSDVAPACIQLAQPRQTPCFPVGTNPARWETGTVSPAGTYTWIFWRPRTCCVDPATPLCGIAAMGGSGANRCALAAGSAGASR
jgi:hypothetical protein